MGIIAHYLSVSEDELALYQAKSFFLEERINNMQLYDANFLDIDKAWDGILFLLTGQGISRAKGDLMRVIVSNQYVDERQDFGYGPAHYIGASEVKELYAQIAQLDEAELGKRFDANRMKELGVYPDSWDEEDAFEYLKGYLLKLVDFFGQASANNLAIIGLMHQDTQRSLPNQVIRNVDSHWWNTILVLSIYALFKNVIYFYQLL